MDDRTNQMELIDLRTAAERTKLPHAWLAQMCRSGRIPFIRGKGRNAKYRVRVVDLESFVNPRGARKA